ncbi:hypothetical protein ES703_22424 [subsurface metagenome]
MENTERYLKKLQELKNDLEKYEKKRDYSGLLAITQTIISKRRKNLEEKIKNCDEEYKELYRKYIDQRTAPSRKNYEKISALIKKISELWNEYDTFSRLEREFEKKNISELISDAKKQYNKYLKEIKQ